MKTCFLPACALVTKQGRLIKLEHVPFRCCLLSCSLAGFPSFREDQNTIFFKFLPYHAFQSHHNLMSVWVVKIIKFTELDYLSETVILVFCEVEGVPWCIGHWACFDSEAKIADYNFVLLSQVRCVSHFISGLGCVNQNSNTKFCLVFNEVLIKQGNLMSYYQSWTE